MTVDRAYAEHVTRLEAERARQHLAAWATDPDHLTECGSMWPASWDSPQPLRCTLLAGHTGNHRHRIAGGATTDVPHWGRG